MTRKLEDRIAQLRQMRSMPPDGETIQELRHGLQDRSGLIVAEAAKTIGHLRLAELIPEMLAAFDRLFDNPAKSDSKCWGKTAIAKVLTELGHTESTPFVRGSLHVQMEPVYGGQEDSAIHLRATCVLALPQCTDLSHFQVKRRLVDALTDAADPVRVEAVRALTAMGGDDAILLLRLKAHFGDRRALIVGHVFDGLLELESEEAVRFVAGFMQAKEAAVRDEAALALGASRLKSAVAVLIDAWNASPDRDFAGVLLRALSSSRESIAIEFLLELVRSGSNRDSALALDALKLHEDTPDIRNRVEEARAQRQSR